MNSAIDELIRYALENEPEIVKEITMSMYRYQKEAREYNELNEQIQVDLWEMESLVNSKKFDFPKEDLDEVGVELDD